MVDRVHECGTRFVVTIKGDLETRMCPKCNVGVRLEHTRPEDAPARLAERIGQSYAAAATSRKEADTYRHAARAERQKGRQLNNVIFELNRRERDGFVSKSRMDPYNSYDLATCKSEVRKHKAAAIEFDALASKHEQAGLEAEAMAITIQTKLNSGASAHAAT